MQHLLNQNDGGLMLFRISVNCDINLFEYISDNSDNDRNYNGDNNNNDFILATKS